MKKNLIIVYAVLFGAYIGISLPLPLIGPLILSDQSPFHIASEMKHLYLSLILAAFPLGHLLGAPLLGSLSDKYGGKKILVFGLTGGAFFYALAGIAIWQGNLVLLIVARIMSGICEGNAAIAQSFLAAIETKNKAKLFGMMVAVISVGYIMGPLVGGAFQFTNLFPFSSSAMPFFAVAVYLLFTMTLVMLFFSPSASSQTESNDMFFALSQLFRDRSFKRLMILALMLSTGRALFVDFLASILKIRFELEIKDTTWIWTLVAAIWGLSALVTHFGSRFISQNTKLVVASGLAGTMLVVVALTQSLLAFFLFSLIAVVGLSFSGTLITVVVSDSAPSKNLGLAMGLLGSTLLLGEVIACLFGGYLLSISDGATLIVGGIMLTLFSLAFSQLFRRRNALSPMVP